MTSDAHILVVDDEPAICRLLVRILRDAGFSADSVTSAAEARERLRAGDVDVMVADVKMPGESGIELVRQTVIDYPDIACLLVSGVDDRDVADTALEFGAYGYLTKPVKRADLVTAVVSALRRRDHERGQREEHDHLVRAIASRTSELQATLARLDGAVAQLRQTRDETIKSLARAVELRDLETAAHVERMSGYCAALAGRIGLEPESMRIASQLHDIGKIGIPDAILLKPGPLNAAERAEMERHAVIGYELLRNSTSEVLKLASIIALTHHERYDGTGYPNGLAGEEIPIEGRVAAIADVYDALTTDRVYSRARSVHDAIETMRAERGKQFDPELLDIFLEMVDHEPLVTPVLVHAV